MASIADLISNLKKKLKGGYNTVADALPIVPNTSQIKSFASNPVQFMANPSYNGGNNLYRTTPFKIGAQVQNNIYKNAQSPDPLKSNFAKMYVGAGEAVRDYFDPRKTPTLLSKQGITNYGKAVGLTALPILNMAMIPKVSPQTFLGSAGIGAGFNALLGNQNDSLAKRMRYGAVSGIQSAPLTKLVTGFTNPLTDKMVSKIPLKNLAPKAKVIIEGVARGAAAIPEGMAINATQRQPYTPLDLALDVSTGSGLSSYAGDKMGKAGGKAVNSFLDWYKKNSMTGSQKAFARQGMIGNVRSMHPEDLFIFDQANEVVQNPKKYSQQDVMKANDFMFRFAEKYLPNKMQPDNANAKQIANRLQKRMGSGTLQTFEGGFAKLDEPIVGTSGKSTPPGRIQELEAKLHPDDVKTLKVDKEIEGWSDKQYKSILEDKIQELNDFKSGQMSKDASYVDLQSSINELRKTAKEIGKPELARMVEIEANKISDPGQARQYIMNGLRGIRDQKFANKAVGTGSKTKFTGYHTPVTTGMENMARMQSSMLPEGKYVALDKPFESMYHDASKTSKVSVDVKNVYDPDGILGKPSPNVADQIIQEATTKKLTAPGLYEKFYADKLKELGYDSYVRNIDGQVGNRELIVLDKTKPQFSPTQMTREEKVLRDQLKRGDITPNEYNEIAVKNEGKIKPIPGTQSGRISDIPQGALSNIRSQAPSQSQISQPQLPPQQPKSGISKIGQPPVQSSSQGIIDSVKNYANQLYTQAVDRFNPLSQAAKQAGQGQAMRNAITQHYGAGSTATYHVDFELSPILKEVNADDLRSYTIAKRDLELAGRNIKGSDKATAQSVIDGLKQKYGAEFTKIETTANRLYSYQDSLVKKYLVETGIISRQNYEAMRRNNQAYIPFKRVMDQVDGFLGVTPQTKSMGSVSSQGVIKRIEGSDRDIIDPLQSIIENTYKIVSVGQRNRVAKAIVSLKDGLPGLVKPFTGEIGNRQDIISVFENGKVQKYQVPKDVAEAAKGLNEESLNALIKILAVPSKLVRATATGINPEFLIPNVTRDVQSAFVNVGLNPLRFVSGVAHLVKKDKVYQDFLRAGGKTSSIMIDRPYLKQTVGEITGKPGIEALNPIRLLQTLGEYSEQPTRIAMFEQTKNKLIKQGLSVAEAEVRAANAAQEGTVNFARMGSKMKAANALVTFLNARLQGADVLIRNVKNKPVGTLFRLGLITQVPAVLSYLYNRQFESYNDERVVSKYDKQNNFILMLSDAPIPSLNGAQFVKIPKGDVGRFANPTENFLSYLDGKGDSNTILEIAKAFGGLSPFQNIGDAIPAAIKPPIEWAANKSFFTGQPLVPEYKQALPEKYQYTSKTAPLYKIIGDKLNVSPAKLENTAAGYLTGFEKMGNAAFNALTGQKPDGQQGSGINRVPIARRFLGGEKRTSDEQNIIDDKRAKSIDFQVNDIKSAVNRGDIPMNDGVRQIELLRQQQQDIRNKQTVTAPTTNTGTADTIGTMGKTYYFKDAEGKLKEISVSAPITAPDLTGNTELDKKLISKYNGKLTSRANDIASLFEAGQIKADEAEKMLSELMTKKISTAKGKTIKIGKVPKIKTPKVKLAKVKSPKIKIPKLKLAKAKAIKLKSLKTKSLVKLKA